MVHRVKSRQSQADLEALVSAVKKFGKYKRTRESEKSNVRSRDLTEALYRLASEACALNSKAFADNGRLPIRQHDLVSHVKDMEAYLEEG